MFGRRSKFERDIRSHLITEGLVGDRRVAEAACLLFLAGSALEITAESHEAMIERLAAAAEQHGADPDQVQAALLLHEPTLV
jgi:alkanesulfonate monooxygenase SsuD/methylene tetrahydromethanopterin reductase-like flavin-dependent oxidoreductase (luciferase family)